MNRSQQLSYYAIPGLQTKATVNYSELIQTHRVEFMNIIRDVVCEQNCMSDKPFHTAKRSSESVSNARRWFCWLLKKQFTPKLSLKIIAEFIYPGFRHSNVIRGCHRVEDILSIDKAAQHHRDELILLINERLINLSQEL